MKETSYRDPLGTKVRFLLFCTAPYCTVLLDPAAVMVLSYKKVRNVPYWFILER